ncbi:metallophosphoesterase family protein [uncultured Tenacibaculum sp.]|uniref:metallophosphoesterase family protein n=1 Tax=uncultured Tenacibaculum sp. TaxID=174713 RepID=UPI00263673B5|nr:metallophosphoesterase family protein [uncultured Tenacibaculum sp.]
MEPRTFTIGDIHGGLLGLRQLIDKLELQQNDTLIFLGDYVDGWSESAQVIDYLMKLREKHDCIFIKGNHDEYCENWLRSGITNDIWLFHGGVKTIESYEGYTEYDKQQHLQFIEQMKLFHIDADNRLFIHAGFSSMHGPQKEVYESNFNWDRTLWETAISLDKTLGKDSPLYPKRLTLFHEIYIGHTPTTRYNQFGPMNGANVWNVDTGAAFKGRLTALNIDTKEFIQSEELYSLYPDESGRNESPYNVIKKKYNIPD